MSLSVILPTALSLTLLVLFIFALVRHGGARRYPILFGVSIVLFLTIGVDSVVYFRDPGMRSPLAQRIFYTDDILRQVAIFILVISLIYRAAHERPEWNWFKRWLVCGVVVTAILFGIVHRGPSFPRVMTNIARDLSFTAMLLNLALWVILVRVRWPDRQLLMVTSGLGIQMAGESIGQSLRLISSEWVVLGNVVLVGSHLLCVTIWWLTFKYPSRPDSPTSGSITGPS